MEEKKPSSVNKTVVALAAVVVVLVVVMGVLVMQLTRSRNAAETGGNETSENQPFRIGYAEGTGAMDEESLQDSVNKLHEKTDEGRIALSYKNDAVSHDGQNFVCYIRNAPSNTYDEFIAIYADAKYEDQLFLSELIRPGEGYEELTLDRALDKGKNLVYVVYTQVKEEDGEQVMIGQTAVTMNFIVRD